MINQIPSLGHVLFTLSVFFIFLLPWKAAGRVRDFETTRLKSTGGAGVASVLMDESAILNPAPIAFFNLSSFYFQKLGTKFADIPNDISSAPSPDQFSANSDTYGLIIADSSGPVKGAASFQNQQEGFDKRKRYSGSLATPIGKLSSLGLLYRYTKDSVHGWYQGQDYHQVDSYGQLVLGAAHAIDANLTFGLVVVDPLRTKKEDTRVLVGAQYVIREMISLMADGGGDYTQDLSNTLLYKVAAQLNFFSDLYFRIGTFYDRGLALKGNGIGLGWISPKLMVDFAVQNSKPLSDSKNIYFNPETRPNYSARDLSFSVSFRF